MDITEVRIKLMDEPGERLKAFCSITFDNCFVVRDLKIIEGTNGPFVAMPSRKLTAHCPKCRSKNHLRAQHCNQCGAKLNSGRMPQDQDGRTKLYADIAHPINSSCREMIQEHVIREFEEEIERAKEPGYVSSYDDFDVDFEEAPTESTDTKAAKENRFDRPHNQRKTHTPRSGGSTEQVPAGGNDPAPPSEKSQKKSDQEEGGDQFGAGIFSDK